MQDKYSDDTDDKIDAARDGMENQSLEQSIIIQFIKTSRLVWYWVTEPQHSYWVGFYLRYHFSGRSVLRIWILPGLQPWAISLTRNLNFAAFLHWQNFEKIFFSSENRHVIYHFYRCHYRHHYHAWYSTYFYIPPQNSGHEILPFEQLHEEVSYCNTKHRITEYFQYSEYKNRYVN